MKKTTKARGKGRMRPVDVASVIAEIGPYRAGERNGRLTWAKLVEFSGFSHVSLWKREKIRVAFQNAQAAMRNDATPQITPPRTADERVVALQVKVEELRAAVESYDEMWVRYEFNMHRLGLDPGELRKPLDRLARSSVRTHRFKIVR
jgi:hypothetical protein